MKATAEARSNIALVKYWGRRDHALNLPLTNSISITLDGLVTRTTVQCEPELRQDVVVINGKEAQGAPLARVVRHLDHLRKRANDSTFCRVHSENNFASSAGLASSASAFAALTVAGFAALGADVEERELTAYARLGSGSAARSIHGGYVEWVAADRHEDSVAHQIAPPGHLDIHDVAITFSSAEKKVGSLEGHGVADSSPLNPGRLARVPDLLDEVRVGIREKDFARIGRAAEEDAYLMHAVMMTSDPSLLYWRPETVDGLHAVRQWREEGIPVYATIDAGPNLHLLTPGSHAARVDRLAQERWPEATTHDAAPGEGAQLSGRHLF